MELFMIILKIVVAWAVAGFAAVAIAAYWIHQATKEFDDEEASQ